MGALLLTNLFRLFGAPRIPATLLAAEKRGG